MYGQGGQIWPLRSGKIDPRPPEVKSSGANCRAKPQPQELVLGYYFVFTVSYGEYGHLRWQADLCHGVQQRNTKTSQK
jgi:hypothetical protein